MSESGPIVPSPKAAPNEVSADRSTAEGAESENSGLDGPLSMRQTLIARRWRQGAVLPESLVDGIQMMPFAKDVSDAARFVVISQDCDVVNGSCELEPAVELVALVPVAETKSAFQNLRNPRELHIRLVNDEGTTQVVAAHVWGRGFLDRRRLMEKAPHLTDRIPEEDLRLLVEFLGRRYDREAFPDEFERRFKRAKARIEKILRDHLAEILDVYVTLEPFEELPAPTNLEQPTDEATYRLLIYVLLSDAVVEGDPKSLNLLKQAIKPEFRKAVKGCYGIQLDDIVFVGRSDVTLDRFEQMHRLDFDAMSFEEEAKDRKEEDRSSTGDA